MLGIKFLGSDDGSDGRFPAGDHGVIRQARVYQNDQESLHLPPLGRESETEGIDGGGQVLRGTQQLARRLQSEVKAAEAERGDSLSMQTVQLAIADGGYTAALRDTLLHSGSWHVMHVDHPDVGQEGVLVMDQAAFNALPQPLPHPEWVVLITDWHPRHLSCAWDAGIMSVVSVGDGPATVLLAIMAAALRMHKAAAAAAHSSGGISPTRPMTSAPLAPEEVPSGPKRCNSH
jgi:hypothetical protein